MDREACHAAVPGVAKSWIWLSNWTELNWIYSTTSANSDSLNSSFSFWIAFSLFFSLIAVARTFKTMINKNGNSEHPCLVPDLPGNAFIFSPLSIMLSVGLLYMAFVTLMYIPSMLTFWRIFTIKGCWIVSKTIFLSIEMIIWFLFFNFLMWYITLTDIQILKNPCIPGMNPTGSWWMIFLVYCWIQIASVLLRIFYLCSSVILACTFLFLCDIFVWLWCQGDDDFTGWIWKFSFFCSLLKLFQKDRC